MTREEPLFDYELNCSGVDIGTTLRLIIDEAHRMEKYYVLKVVSEDPEPQESIPYWCKGRYSHIAMWFREIQERHFKYFHYILKIKDEVQLPPEEMIPAIHESDLDNPERVLKTINSNDIICIEIPWDELLPRIRERLDKEQIPAFQWISVKDASANVLRGYIIKPQFGEEMSA